MAEPGPALVVEHLTVRSADAVLVDDLRLTVGRGETVALVGESGSGKSLTTAAIIGLLPDGLSVSGSVEVGGEQIVDRPESDLGGIRGRKVSLVFQDPLTALNPTRRIWRQFHEVLRLRGRVTTSSARARATQLLTAVGIPDPGDRVTWYPHQFSGGQRQRIVIALALAGEPDLLVADEPTTALDVTVQASILELLRDLSRTREMALLIITHDMGVAADIAQRIVVLRDGSVVESGDIAQVFAAPRHEYTRKLLASVPRLGDAGSAPQPAESGSGDNALVTLSDAGVTYPGATVPSLCGITLDVHAGEVLALVGESGSGKTTLGRAILGLTPITEGARHTDEPTFALIHQDPFSSLNPRWSVGRSIAEPMVLAHNADAAQRRSRVAKLLAAVRLPAEIAARRPVSLSGGQRQRVAIARALASDPDVVVADEPTSALDVSVQADVLELIAHLQDEQGFGLVFITHDLAVVSEVADRVAVLRDGRIVETGDVMDVLGNPSDPYTRELLDSVLVADPVEQRRRRSARTGGQG
ncbi:ABC transporter ATP-binding protein [Williamsia sp.]|uniref:dipeptide ABC transporter ATP-binding protein n=1 Tax=Williamsia sp. TaxID=1872085 RepID=UPI001A227C8B|nr:ABC transporter ATP-binding protein [Williamsia sp.]MBJ7287837.1 ABC transporter ATP-binding protein [Williamsia sp.]